LLQEDNPTTVYTPGFGHRSNGVNKFYHVDWIGSTRYTSDLTGNGFPAALRYDAYGQRSATGGPDPYHSTDLQYAGAFGYQTEWSGGAADPGLGLQYLEQRYYDPAVGRFISPDPIGLEGGLNLYGYVGNDPVMYTDPTGEIAPLVVLGLVVAVGWLLLESEAPADVPDPCYQHTPITDQIEQTLGIDRLREGLQFGQGGLRPEMAGIGDLPDGVGPYWKVGGHHIHAKSLFKGDPNYSPGNGLSVGQRLIEEGNLNHPAMTTRQREEYRAPSAQKKVPSWREHNRIAVEALKEGGVGEPEARGLVARSMRMLRELKVKLPSRLPRFGR
jgi:RHS repeat-associated protein